MKTAGMKKIVPHFLKKAVKRLSAYGLYAKDYRNFRRLSKKRGDFFLSWKNRFPVLFEKTESTHFDAHYIYHPAWAARIVKKIHPAEHIDISSTLHFCTMLSAFIPVRFYDYRPANIIMEGLASGKADVTHLPFKDGSIASLSCMHTVEHVGLGRYGDPLDAFGDLKAMNELKRVLAPNGNLLFVVPIGKPKICFNAHRIYSYEQIMKYFEGLTLVEFSLIPDNARAVGMIRNASAKQADEQKYGCGCFWFKK